MAQQAGGIYSRGRSVAAGVKRRGRNVGHAVFKRVAAMRSRTGYGRPICDDVEEWSRQHGVESQTLFVARRFTRSLPRTVEPAVDAEYVSRQHANQRRRYLVPVRGAKLFGPNGLVALPDGSWAAESVYGRSYVGEDPAYYLPKRRPVLRKSGHYFSLVGKWGIQAQGNYYHWLHDTVERLFGVIPLLPVDTRYIVPANLTPLQIETLRLVGVKEDQLADFSGEEVWELETLHFAPPTSNSGSHRRDADEWLRDKILDGCGIAPTPAKRRIFISRRQAPNRRLVNEAEVEDYLHRCGFETWVPERLPICEQAKVFSQAEIVVSTHGAGLTNMLFAPRGLVVVDMIQPDMLPMAYVFWAMAEELGHQYWYFVAEAVPQPASRPDTIVPLEKLMATFDRLGYSPEASERPADAGDTVVLPDAADDTVVLPDDVGPNERSRPSRQARD